QRHARADPADREPEPEEAARARRGPVSEERRGLKLRSTTAEAVAGVAAAAALPVDSRAVDQAWLDELSEFIRIPSVSADPERAGAVQQAGEWVCEFVRRAGGEAELRDWNGHPLALGEVPASTGNGEPPTVT